MPNTRREFQQFVEESKVKKLRSREREIREVAQAAVPIGRLTNDENWDFFLSIVQEQVDRLGALIESLQAAAFSDPSFEYADLVSRKAAIDRAKTQKATLEQIMALPKDILEKGIEAKLALDKLEDE